VSEKEFLGAVAAKLRAAGHEVVDAEDQVTLSVKAFTELLSGHNLEVVQQFVRLQRMAGVQTIHYASVKPDSFSCLVERMADFNLLLDKDKEQAKQMLQQQVVDIRPVVDERLFSLCNQHRVLADFGLVASQDD
jgi:hypothetical protein